MIFPASIGADIEVDRQQLFPNPIPGSEVWSASGPSVHCTRSDTFVYNRRRPGPEHAPLGVGGLQGMEWVGSLDLVLHCGEEDVRVTLHDVAVVPGFVFENAVSLTQIAMHESALTMHATGVTTEDGRYHFSKGTAASYLQATRVPHGATPQE